MRAPTATGQVAPTAQWTGQQLREAFPFDPPPRYLLRDRDAIFGDEFRDQVRDLGIREVLSTPRSPWQRAYVERVIGSIRRECLDHVIVFRDAASSLYIGAKYIGANDIRWRVPFQAREGDSSPVSAAGEAIIGFTSDWFDSPRPLRLTLFYKTQFSIGTGSTPL